MTSFEGAIIGSGIAGLSAAIFARQKGIDLALFEQGRDSSIDDHLLWIAPNGLHILNLLGLDATLWEKSAPQEEMQFSDRNLRPLMTLTGASLRKSCGFPIVAIKRKLLWDALARCWQNLGGTTFTSHRLENIVDHKQFVELSFNKKQENVNVNWVLGADGMGSLVRQTLFPDSYVEYQGIRTWLGQSLLPSIAPRYVGKTIEAWGNTTRFVLTSIDGRSIHFSALERAKVYEKNSAPIPEDTLSRLQKLFSEYHSDIQDILSYADPKSLVRCNFGVVSGLKKSYAGRVALIGDAAHGMPPNMGQGASLGFEDSLAVIHALSRLKDPIKAFHDYHKARRKRVATMRQLANSMNVLFQPKSRIAQRFRNVGAFLVPDALTALRMGQLYKPSLPTT